MLNVLYELLSARESPIKLSASDIGFDSSFALKKFRNFLLQNLRTEHIKRKKDTFPLLDVIFFSVIALFGV